MVHHMHCSKTMKSCSMQQSSDKDEAHRNALGQYMSCWLALMCAPWCATSQRGLICCRCSNHSVSCILAELNNCFLSRVHMLCTYAYASWLLPCAICEQCSASAMIYSPKESAGLYAIGQQVCGHLLDPTTPSYVYTSACCRL
jgi:hypothetical protein